MLSTFLNYRLYSADMAKSLARIEADPVVSREAAYYKANIGKVTDIESFLDDYRLYSYAMKAHGLEDQIPSRALMRKVLESDLSDGSSFANKLVDERYREFAAAFSFKPAGETALKPQTADQGEAITEAYSEHRVRGGLAAAAKTAHYQERIGSIASVDQLVGDPVMFDIMMTAIGADPSVMSEAFIRDVLVGNAGDEAAARGDYRFVWLAGQFNFEPDGSLAPGAEAQSADAVAELIYRYNEESGNGTSPQAAAYKTGYFEERIAAVRSAAEIVDDPKLMDVMLTSFGLDPDIELPSFVELVLESDLDDPQSTVNAMAEDSPAASERKQKYLALAAAFNFDGQGNVPDGESAQTAQATASLIDGYYENYKTEERKADNLETSLFRARISTVDSVNRLLFDQSLYEYALKAFDLDPRSESLTDIARVLKSDLSDPASFANRLGDPRYVDLAAAFNFGADGRLAPPRFVQSEASKAATARLYAELGGPDQSASEKAAVKAETTAYLDGIDEVRSLDGLLGEKSLLDYALKAFGLDGEKVTTETLRRVLTSDLGDRESYVYSLGDERFEKFAAAFNFLPDGRIQPTDEKRIQSRANVLSTQKLYLLQTMETEAGAENPGVRLALYFDRKLPEINSPYDILADTALLEVVRTALGLPAEMSQIDIDRQAAMIEKRLDIAGLRDARTADRFISRFTALYDLQNGGTAAPSPALTILGGGGGTLGFL